MIPLYSEKPRSGLQDRLTVVILDTLNGMPLNQPTYLACVSIAMAVIAKSVPSVGEALSGRM